MYMPNPQLATSSRHGINPPNFALSKYPGFGHLVLVVWGRSRDDPLLGDADDAAELTLTGTSTVAQGVVPSRGCSFSQG